MSMGVLTESYVQRVSLNWTQVESTEGYPFALPAVRNVEQITFNPAVTFLVGENGSGKSTLLEAIAIAWGFNPEGGTLNFKFGTRPSHSNFYKHIRLVKSVKRPRDGFFFRAESLFNLASEIENLDKEPSFGPPIINSYGYNSLHEQSHGESFLSVMNHRFAGYGFYILDEPDAALSPTSQLAMLARMHQLVHSSSQFIIATHSPILLAYPNAWIYEIGPIGPRRISYTESSHVVITRRFLNDPAAQLKRLLE